MSYEGRIFNKVERTWSFGPGGSRNTDNWMGGENHHIGANHHTYQHNREYNVVRNDADVRDDFKRKFPTIPAVDELDNGFSATVHQRAERIGRDKAIIAYAGGHGERIIAVYYADRLNPNGAEYHFITNNGIIIITNAEKDNGRQIVTKLIARPGQLKRYPNNQLYGDSKYGHGQEQVDAIQVYPSVSSPSGSNWRVPKQVLDLAQLHQDLGLNEL